MVVHLWCQLGARRTWMTRKNRMSVSGVKLYASCVRGTKNKVMRTAQGVRTQSAEMMVSWCLKTYWRRCRR